MAMVVDVEDVGNGNGGGGGDSRVDGGDGL